MQTKRFNVSTNYLVASNETSVRYFSFTICYVPSMLERRLLVMSLPDEIGSEVRLKLPKFRECVRTNPDRHPGATFHVAIALVWKVSENESSGGFSECSGDTMFLCGT